MRSYIAQIPPLKMSDPQKAALITSLLDGKLKGAEWHDLRQPGAHTFSRRFTPGLPRVNPELFPLNTLAPKFFLK